MRTRTLLAALIAASSLIACDGNGKHPANPHNAGSGSETATDGRTSPAGGKSLYDRLGAKDAITGIVDDFVANVAQDKRINQFFTNADIPGFKQKLVDQICEVSGGPCHYTGKDMKTAHAGMAIKDADFSALVEDLKKSLDKFRVEPKEQKDLLDALAKMHAEIVTAK
jgi:hemoglobin